MRALLEKLSNTAPQWARDIILVAILALLLEGIIELIVVPVARICHLVCS